MKLLGAMRSTLLAWLVLGADLGCQSAKYDIELELYLPEGDGGAALKKSIDHIDLLIREPGQSAVLNSTTLKVRDGKVQSRSSWVPVPGTPVVWVEALAFSADASKGPVAVGQAQLSAEQIRKPSPLKIWVAPPNTFSAAPKDKTPVDFALRDMAVVSLSNGDTWILGGYDPLTDQVTGQVFVYSASHAALTLSNVKLTPRRHLSATLLHLPNGEERIVVLGGYLDAPTMKPRPSPIVEVINPATDKLTSAALSKGPRAGAALVWVGERQLALIGGDDGLFNVPNWNAKNMEIIEISNDDTVSTTQTFLGKTEDTLDLEVPRMSALAWMSPKREIYLMLGLNLLDSKAEPTLQKLTGVKGSELLQLSGLKSSVRFKAPDYVASASTIYAFGGDANNIEKWRWDGNTLESSQIAPPFKQKLSHLRGVILSDDSLFLTGGEEMQAVKSKMAYLVGPLGSPLSSALPASNASMLSARSHHAMFMQLNKQIIVLGGQDDGTGIEFINLYWKE